MKPTAEDFHRELNRVHGDGSVEESMMDLPRNTYLTERQAHALRAGMRSNTAQGRTIDIITMWMHGRMLLAERAPVAVGLLQRNALAQMMEK